MLTNTEMFSVSITPQVTNIAALNERWAGMLLSMANEWVRVQTEFTRHLFAPANYGFVAPGWSNYRAPKLLVDIAEPVAEASAQFEAPQLADDGADDVGPDDSASSEGDMDRNVRDVDEVVVEKPQNAAMAILTHPALAAEAALDSAADAAEDVGDDTSDDIAREITREAAEEAESVASSR